jgi:hypothetical protein
MTAFARVTRDHDILGYGYSPCARDLYRYLLRACPAGREFEFELEDFNEEVNLGRSRPFSLYWLKVSLKQLVEKGIVIIVKKFNACCYKLITLHPSQINDNKTQQDFNENCKIEPSNADSFVPIHIEKIENNK